MKRPKLKPITLALIAVATLAVIVITAVSLLSDKRGQTEDQTAAAPPKAALTVTTVKPEQIDTPLKLVANGNIAAWQEAIVGSESNGLRLTDVRVNVGDRVKAGQVLATFAEETGKADVAQARAALLEAQANAADAAANAARARTLTETGALSTQQINQYLTTEQTAKARVEAARATLAAQELRLKQTRLLAPDDGVISSRSATVGSVVPAGTELFRLIRQGRLEWRAEVTSSELGRLRTGTRALVTAANGTQLKGSVRKFAPTVDPQTRIALVYVDLPTVSEEAAPPKAGMFARGEFDLGSTKALTVPQQSVVVRDGFSYVFRVNQDNRVSQIKVQTGRRLPDSIEIVDGIAADAVLVGNGAGFLNDGDLVKVVTSASK